MPPSRRKLPASGVVPNAKNGPRPLSDPPRPPDRLQSGCAMRERASDAPPPLARACRYSRSVFRNFRGRQVLLQVVEGSAQCDPRALRGSTSKPSTARQDLLDAEMSGAAGALSQNHKSASPRNKRTVTNGLRVQGIRAGGGCKPKKRNDRFARERTPALRPNLCRTKSRPCWSGAALLKQRQRLSAVAAEPFPNVRRVVAARYQQARAPSIRNRALEFGVRLRPFAACRAYRRRRTEISLNGQG